MRKFYIGLLLFILSFSSYAQTVQSTVKAGTVGNSVFFSIKPSVDIVNSKLSTLYFSLAIPATTIPRPTAAIKNNLNAAISYNLEVVPLPELVNGTLYYFYNFLGDGAQGAGVERTYTAGVDNNLVEVAFTGGPQGTSTVLLVNLPNGGVSQNSSFYIANMGTDITNKTAMFYGGTPVNSPAGDAGLSYTNVAGIALPTKFLSFFATKSDDIANLTWTVENEENNAYFEVERSLDGRNFNKVYQVQALRNGRTSNTYTTPDANISRLGVRIIYYRIRQVETSGQVVYSEIRQVSLTDKNFAASLFPNPVKTSTKLVIDAPEAGKATVIIRDAAGKTVKAISLQLVKGINQQQLDATLFATGDYNVTIVSEKLNQTIKMTKAN